MKSLFTQDIVSEQVVTKYEKDYHPVRSYVLKIEYSAPVYRYGTKGLVIQRKYSDGTSAVVELNAHEILALKKVLNESSRFPKSKNT